MTCLSVFLAAATGSSVPTAGGRIRSTVGRLRAGQSTADPPDQDAAGLADAPGNVRLVEDVILHDGWRRLVRRTVRLPSALVVDYEIVAQRGSDRAVLVFVWNTRTQTATLVREYMPALHQRVLGLAAGMVEEKHQDGNGPRDAQRTAAEQELEEECRRKGGTWYRLTEEDSTMDKYCSTKLGVYLVIDPIPVSQEEALPRDATEEGMEVVTGITIPELLDLIYNGKLTVVGGWASLLAITKLRAMDLL